MMPQREQHLLPERVIGGKYRIVRLLGEGGMGGVYEAENELTQKRVAIKWLHAMHSTSRDAVQRLLREAQASARVRHPNVVDVYDVGQEGDSVFLVMEYLEGETLGQALARKDLDLAAAIGLLIPAMRGVAAAHAQGIVHRDIKPDNIFLSRVPGYATPVPKVLDFGISKVDARQGQLDTLTQSGVTMGTPLYMSFEQLSGAKDADVRSDVYAFGVILYEAATGQPPFQAESFAALAVKVATTDPAPPRRLNPAVTPDLESIILQAMARERSQRFPGMDDLINALEPYALAQEARNSHPRPAQVSNPPAAPQGSIPPGLTQASSPPAGSPAAAPAAFAATLPGQAASITTTDPTRLPPSRRWVAAARALLDATLESAGWDPSSTEPRRVQRSRRWAAAALVLVAVVAAASYLSGLPSDAVKGGAIPTKQALPVPQPPPPPVSPLPRPSSPPLAPETTATPTAPATAAKAAPPFATPEASPQTPPAARREPKRKPAVLVKPALEPAATTTKPAVQEPAPAPPAAPDPKTKGTGFRAGQPNIDEF